MRHLLAVLLISLSSFGFSNCNFGFTEKQEKVIELAYISGLTSDVGFTIAAIVWKESFVGKYIIRNNNPDGKLGSYGVTHVQLSTAMYMVGIESSWKARDELLPRMIADDQFVIDLSIQYLNKFSHLPYRKKVARYNGAGEAADKYAEDIINRVHRLMGCGYFDYLDLDV